MANEVLLKPEERVLSTLENDGSRRWLHPRLAKGRFLTRRRIVAYILLAIYTLVPFIKINGYPALLFDLGAGKFHVLGVTFLPTDTVMLSLFMITVFLTVFAATAVAGRVWCGWACPQTVYLEFVFRPFERLFIGKPGIGGKPREGVAAWRYFAMYALFLLISLHLAHTFLSYFIGIEKLNRWIWNSTPFAHPAAFGVVGVFTAWMMFDFCFWREQMCIIGCPYGRFQSVLLDRWSAIVGYDTKRGEPRGKLKKMTVAERAVGDCIDCSMCVTVCPTGIDIRDGLQLECVGCTQCIDACDAVMDKIGKPRGLIRYSSQASLAGEPGKIIRPRVVIYGLIWLGLVSLLTYKVVTKSPLDFTPLRGLGRAYVMNDDGSVENTLQLYLVNRTDAERTYHLSIVDNPAVQVTVQGDTVTIPAGESKTVPGYFDASAQAFIAGRLPVKIRATDDQNQFVDKPFVLLGPMNPPPPSTPAPSNSTTE